MGTGWRIVRIVILTAIRVGVPTLNAAAALPGRTLPGPAGPFLVAPRGCPGRQLCLVLGPERLICLPAGPVGSLCTSGPIWPVRALVVAAMLRVRLTRRATGRGALLCHSAPPEGRWGPRMATA